MDKIVQPLPPVVGVGFGAVATVDCPIGPNYHVIWAEITATVAAGKIATLQDFADMILVKANGRVQRAHLATELDALNMLNGPEFQCNVTGGTGAAYGVMVAPTTTVGTSSGFAVGDLIALPACGGNALVPTLLQVTTATAGALTAVRVLNPGCYTIGNTTAFTAAGLVPTIVRSAAGVIGTATLAATMVALPSTMIPPGILSDKLMQPTIPQGGDTVTVQLPIFLAEPSRKSYSATESFSWPTAWPNGYMWESLTVDISVPSTGNLDTTKPLTILAYAETDARLGSLDAAGVPIENIVRFSRLGVGYTGAGDLFITNLTKKDVYQQISLFGQAADIITAAKVKVSNVTKREVTAARNNAALIARQLNEAALTPTRFDLVFDYTDLPTDSLILSANGKVASSFQVIATLGTATAANKQIFCISQIYGPLE